MITTFFVLMAVKAEDVDAGTASRRTRSIGAPRLLDQYAARASGKFSPVTTTAGSLHGANLDLGDVAPGTPWRPRRRRR